MQPSGDDGAVLDAGYHVEPEGELLALVLESWSGSGKGGSPPARNPDYNRALTTRRSYSRRAEDPAVPGPAAACGRETAGAGRDPPLPAGSVTPGPVMQRTVLGLVSHDADNATARP